MYELPLHRHQAVFEFSFNAVIMQSISKLLASIQIFTNLNIDTNDKKPYLVILQLLKLLKLKFLVFQKEFLIKLMSNNWNC